MSSLVGVLADAEVLWVAFDTPVPHPFSYVVPDGLFKSVEIGAYYTGNTANAGFYTDLTGYNTAKDAGIVYVKKTF